MAYGEAIAALDTRACKARGCASKTISFVLKQAARHAEHITLLKKFQFVIYNI
jgi:hypothetical protein